MLQQQRSTLKCDAIDCWHKKVAYNPGTMMSIVANCPFDVAIINSHSTLAVPDMTPPFDINLCHVCSHGLPLRETMICAICASYMCSPWLTLVGKHRARLYCRVCVDETDCVNMDDELHTFLTSDSDRVITRSKNRALYKEAARYIKLVERLTLSDYNPIPRKLPRRHSATSFVR